MEKLEVMPIDACRCFYTCTGCGVTLQAEAWRLLHAVPAISGARAFVAAGGLMSYGNADLDAYRFEVHFEKLRNRVDGNGAVPFEARIENGHQGEGIRWLASDLAPPKLKQAATLFSDGHSVRQVAALLGISSSEAGRLRLRAVDAGLFATGEEIQLPRANGSRPPLPAFRGVGG
jgi:hypothetical protein